MDILLDDNSIVVVNKPGGLLAVPGRGPDKQDCVVNRVKRLYPECIEQPSVHRLDMYTSGLMVLALTKEAHKMLSRQFEERRVKKKYIALLDGQVECGGGEIKLAFRLDVDNRPYQIYDPIRGKLGVSLWRKLSENGTSTRVEFEPITGRTHQLRVHAAHKFGLNCPIVGDKLYGNGREGDQMMLHATYLRFTHPQTEKTVEITSEPPF